MANYYEILEVAPTAAKKEIKKSYYRLSKQYHPDHNPGDAAAEEKFKAVGKAYSVLSDDAKRKEYDEQLAAGCSTAGHRGWKARNCAGQRPCGTETETQNTGCLSAGNRFAAHAGELCGFLGL